MDSEHTVSNLDGLHVIEYVRLAIHPVDSDHQLLTHKVTVVLTESHGPVLGMRDWSQTSEKIASWRSG